MLKLGPRELMGRMAAEVEGGSAAPENVPQNRADAQAFVALSQDPRLNGEKLLLRALELWASSSPRAISSRPTPQIPAPTGVAPVANAAVGPDQTVTYDLSEGSYWAVAPVTAGEPGLPLRQLPG
jgi:hypothetical protein